MLFVSLHGGKPGKHPVRNNVHAYDKDGAEIARSVLDEAQGLVLDELRGMYSAGNRLYVVIGNINHGSVVCYEGSGTSYRFVSTFVSQKTCEAVVHPFDFTFDDSGYCYLSNQDTNVVTRLTVAAGGKTGTPAPLPPALGAHGKLLPGTFVASSVANLCDLPTTAVPPPQGLEYSAEGAKKHSVRGLAWINDALYVADQPAARVKVYDGSGRFLGQSNQIESPVHIVPHQGSLYVSGGNSVFTAKLAKPAGDFVLSPIPGLHVKNGGGMAFTDSGHLFIASRTENVILKFDADFRPMKFSCELPDNPEFLLHV